MTDVNANHFNIFLIKQNYRLFYECYDSLILTFKNIFLLADYRLKYFTLDKMSQNIISNRKF